MEQIYDIQTVGFTRIDKVMSAAFYWMKNMDFKASKRKILMSGLILSYEKTGVMMSNTPGTIAGAVAK